MTTLAITIPNGRREDSRNVFPNGTVRDSVQNGVVVILSFPIIHTLTEETPPTGDRGLSPAGGVNPFDDVVDARGIGTWTVGIGGTNHPRW